MKTPEEIKRDAETCMNHPYMESCNSCRLYKDCHGISDHIVKELYDLALHYESRLAQAERERDAALRDMKELAKEYDYGYVCSFCSKQPSESCEQCKIDYSGFEWRGPCPENTKEADSDGKAESTPDP